ncbi:hypothetical protein [Atopobium deltae]|uniref:Uncharacterized protein n=1 Tax=Atopobium deltae TaxID=1393034 RepID=A0A133XTW9_9ACTN|nr:hypothetical protein [Atopobium deltae]KXB34380.1 hypothetical protein HMPREF3192_00932 [Atopobium deltae]
MIFSSIEYVIGYVQDVLEIPTSTYAQKNTPNAYALVDRTGGVMDYPHDAPEYSVSIYTKSEAKSEELAHVLAIGLKTRPMKDVHVNTCAAPNVFSYGRDDAGYFIWQVSFSLVCNIHDE